MLCFYQIQCPWPLISISQIPVVKGTIVELNGLLLESPNTWCLENHFSTELYKSFKASISAKLLNPPLNPALKLKKCEWFRCSAPPAAHKYGSPELIHKKTPSTSVINLLLNNLSWRLDLSMFFEAVKDGHIMGCTLEWRNGLVLENAYMLG